MFGNVYEKTIHDFCNISLSSVSIESFSNNVIRLEFDPILLKYGFRFSKEFGCPLHS